MKVHFVGVGLSSVAATFGVAALEAVLRREQPEPAVPVFRIAAASA